MARKRLPVIASDLVSRRAALQTIGLGLGAAAFGSGCLAGPDRCPAGPQETVVGPDYDKNGAPSARRLLDGIDTFVVLMMENRSFDHLFGSLALDSAYPSKLLVDGLKGDEHNFDTDGTPVVVHRKANITNDGPHHSWEMQRKYFANGTNSGFVKSNEGERKLDAMAYLTRDDIPIHYALADRYCVADRWFSSVMGPTWPNRFYLHAATSGGKKTNEAIVNGPATLWEKLGKNCASCKNYAGGPAHWYYAAFRGRPFSGNEAMNGVQMEKFFQDAKQGTLPNFSVLDPDFWSNDMHPPHTLALGEAFIAAVVRAMEQSPQWKRSMLVITYDENGGFFDHVAPPTTADERPEFRQLGFRVPTLVIGPTVRRGVVSTQFDHTSIAATMKTRFGIESLGERMDAANDLSSCIDPSLVGLTEGPMGKLPDLEIDARRIKRAGFPYSSQPWVDGAILNGHIAGNLIDQRSHEERLNSMLRQIQELDVAKVIG